MNCDKKFSEGRVGADPRLKIALDDGALSWRIQDMNAVTARECAARIALHIRNMDMYGKGSVESRKVGKVGAMIVVTSYEDEPPSICVAHEPESGAVQASVSGMTLFQATIVCESFVFEMNKMMMGETIQHGAAI
ncbi:MAG: hypothetical protein KAJ73_05455 [Zetaproteobacteria bacterium]|nr:hypothetical protein [Zetaproteobacteria bacterium]